MNITTAHLLYTHINNSLYKAETKRHRYVSGLKVSDSLLEYFNNKEVSSLFFFWRGTSLLKFYHLQLDFWSIHNEYPLYITSSVTRARNVSNFTAWHNYTPWCAGWSTEHVLSVSFPLIIRRKLKKIKRHKLNTPLSLKCW